MAGKWNKIVQGMSPVPVDNDKQVFIDAAIKSILHEITARKAAVLMGPPRDKEGISENRPWTQNEIMRLVSEGQITADDIKVTASDIADAYARYREQEDIIDEEAKAAAQFVEACRQLIVKHYEEEGVQKLTLSNGRSVALEVEPYAGVEPEKKAEFREWCLDDPELALAMTLPWPTLNSMVKELLTEGKDLPPGVKVFLKSKVVLRG